MKITHEDINCKYCRSGDIVLNGSYRGTQRYLCRTCGRGFTNPDNLPRVQFPTKMIASAIGEYISGTSLHSTTRNLKRDYNIPISHDTIYKWIQKYVPISLNEAGNCNFKFGDTWIADETVIKAGTGKKLSWLFVCIDAKTRFVLATHLTPNRGTKDAVKLFSKATEAAKGQIPKLVITDGLRSYSDALERLYGADTEHIVSTPFGGKISTSIIERWHGTLKDRMKPARGLLRIETAQNWLDVFVHDYNFYRPHSTLGDRTPAEVADAKFPYKDWIDVIKSQAYPTADEILSSSPTYITNPAQLKRVKTTRKRKRKPSLAKDNIQSKAKLARIRL